MIFDPTKDTLRDSFGISDERLKELVDKYMVGSYGEILSLVLNEKTDMTEAEKAFFLIDFGVKMVFSEIQARQPTVNEEELDIQVEAQSPTSNANH